MQTSVPGSILNKYPSLSKVEFTDLNMMYAGTKNIALRFTIYTTNPIPLGGRVYIDWGWQLDCTQMKLSVKCLDNTCSFNELFSHPDSDSKYIIIPVKCDPETNRIEL